MDAENVTEDEREIVTMIADILINRSIDQPSRILELVNHRVIAARTGQSVVLYIYCKTIEDLEQLHESLLSGRLKNSVELWFNFLLKRSEKITVSAVTVPNEEFQTIGTKLKGNNLFSIEVIALRLRSILSFWYSFTFHSSLYIAYSNVKKSNLSAISVPPSKCTHNA